MSDNQPEIISHGDIDTDGDDTQRQRFTAFLALALGTLGALGGGVVATALQALVFVRADNSYPDALITSVTGGAPVLIGAVAIVLGLQAAALRDPLNSPIGKVGAVLGAVAVVGGVLYVVALLNQ